MNYRSCQTVSCYRITSCMHIIIMEQSPSNEFTEPDSFAIKNMLQTATVNLH